MTKILALTAVALAIALSTINELIKDWVEKKVRRHMAHARKRKGFGWERWSRPWLYNTLKLFNSYRVRRGGPKAVEGWRGKAGASSSATFPVPSTSHAACGFPALRAPICFTSKRTALLRELKEVFRRYRRSI
jgi:RNA-directed DNA polymerase